MSLAGTMNLDSYRQYLREKLESASLVLHEDIQSAIPTLSEWSTKDVEEQGYVTSYIEEVLSRYSDNIEKIRA